MISPIRFAILASALTAASSLAALAGDFGPDGMFHFQYHGMNHGGGSGGHHVYRPSPPAYTPPPAPPQPSAEEVERDRRERQATNLNNDAVNFMRRGEYIWAVVLLHEAEKFNPDDRVIKSNSAISWAELYYDSKKYSDAIEQIRIAIALGGKGLESRLAYFQEQEAKEEARRRAEEAERHEAARREAAAAVAREEEARQEAARRAAALVAAYNTPIETSVASRDPDAARRAEDALNALPFAANPMAPAQSASALAGAEQRQPLLFIADPVHAPSKKIEVPVPHPSRDQGIHQLFWQAKVWQAKEGAEEKIYDLRRWGRDNRDALDGAMFIAGLPFMIGWVGEVATAALEPTLGHALRLIGIDYAKDKAEKQIENYALGESATPSWGEARQQIEEYFANQADKPAVDLPFDPSAGR